MRTRAANRRDHGLNARPNMLPAVGESSTRASWSGAGVGEQLWFLGTLATIKVAGRTCDGRFALLESLFPRHASPPLHTHPQDESYLVLEDGSRFRVQRSASSPRQARQPWFRRVWLTRFASTATLRESSCSARPPASSGWFVTVRCRRSRGRYRQARRLGHHRRSWKSSFELTARSTSGHCSGPPSELILSHRSRRKRHDRHCEAR